MPSHPRPYTARSKGPLLKDVVAKTRCWMIIIRRHSTLLFGRYLRTGYSQLYQLVYNAICNLKRAQHPDSKAPSYSWFGKWWTASELHKIKSMPLAIIRLTAQDEQVVKRWLEERSGRVARSGLQPWGAAYNGGDCTGTERLVMTPIWLEMTSAEKCRDSST
jgi:hypothetical protein